MMTEPSDSKPFPQARVLVVDDLEDARWVLSNLMRQAGFVALSAGSGEEALSAVRTQAPDLVLLDIGLPDMDGFEVLAKIKEGHKTLPVIMVTANGKTHDAVRAVRAGAWDYLTKPFKNEDVVRTVRYAFEERKSKLQVRQISDAASNTDSLVKSMGNSLAIQGIQREVERVAKTNFSILVTGESGTGKELLSQAIHARSNRSAKPLVAVDCGAISENLIESELFGHEKGAFTGAHQAKAGAFELAEGGTIFLDEIGNLPLAMQGKLLRVLETRRIHRIGATKEQKVDFRVVAATNADLLAMVDQRTFRGDLYHRLAEYTIHLTALRERKEDLVFLVHRFLAQTNAELSKQVKGLSVTAWAILQRYDWPGNARELRNQLRRAVLLCDSADGLIGPELISTLDQRTRPLQAYEPEKRKAAWLEGSEQKICPLCDPAGLLAAGRDLPMKEAVAQITAQVERAMLMRTLALTQGNKAQAARLLQIDYKTIHSKLKTYEISSIQFMKDDYKHREDLDSD